MNSDHVSRERENGMPGAPGRSLFADSNNLSNYGDLQFGAANNQYDPSLWPPDHGPDEVTFPANHQSHALRQGWNSNTIPIHHDPASASVNTGYHPYTHQTSAAYPGHNFFNGHLNYNESRLDPSLTPGPAQNAYNLAASTYSSTISPQALQHSNIADFSKLGTGRSSLRNIDTPLGVSRDRDDSVSLEKVPLKAPRGTESGSFVVTDYDALVEATKSQRLHNFVNIGTVQIDTGNYLKTSLPNYIRRQSRNDFRRRAGDDKALLGKLARHPRGGKEGSEVDQTVAKAAKKPSKLKNLTQKTPYQRSPISRVDQAGRIKPEISQSATESDTSSEESDSDFSDSDLEVADPPPLPDKRPAAPLEAVRYDTIKAVWASPNRPADPDEIRNALKSFWEVVRTIRDRWKSDGNALKQAEEAKKSSELPLLKDRVNSQRDMMQASINAALEFGHQDVLALFGENASFLFLSYQFLLDRFSEKDFDGPLSRGFLELLARCTTITNEALEKTHLVKVLPRFEKRGKEWTAGLAKKVIAEAEKLSKTKGEAVAKEKAVKNATKEVMKIDPTPDVKTKPEPITGMKRQREGANPNVQPTKKLNASSPSSSSSSSSGSTKPTTAPVKRATSITSTDTKMAPSSAVIPKAKGQQVQAKPSSFFSSLQSAAKRPGTGKASTISMVEKDKNASEKKATVSSTPVATTRPAWSFAETMANLNKAKEPEPTAKPKLNTPPESPEERAKRLRKEERRKLRVTFKPEASLVEVRVFERQDEELIDRDNNVRDVDDIKGEGQMFKQHIDTVEDEDDDDYTPQLGEVSLVEFCEPSYIDFCDIEKSERERNYAPYGGGELIPESPESKLQEEHERNTLMVFYTDRMDIPPNPREPLDPYTGEVPMTVTFGQPPSQVLQRAEAARSAATQAPTSSHVPDVSALLKALGGVHPQLQPQGPPQQQKQDAGTSSTSALEGIFAKFANPAQQPQPQQAQMQPPVQPQQQVVNPQLQAILASMQSQAPAQQPLQQGQQAAQPNLAALLQQLQQPSVSNSGPGIVMPGQHGAALPRTGPFEDPERKRWREDQDANQGNFGGQGSQGSGTKKRKYPFVDKKFTLPCKFFREGKCMKGAQCTYVHE
ncbi:hypothetical protein EV356DRAFT_535262 [Viridothelium virens]|uniref:C3H1-type domain-containing protein n=1 Tax=Viridothelium virens TaxID=1048519 RepID=A0A6A6H2E8_VIRVR|nr:hypothetical protein EV356DRAFT_535262 [Viridothelium virens]